MADNVAVTAGSGTSIATDDVSSVHFQKVKLDAGGDGVSVPVIAGQQTAAASVPVVLASDKAVGTNADAAIAAGTAPSKALVAGAVYNSTEISPTTGQTFAIQADSKGRTRMVIMDAAGNTRGANVDANSNMGVVLPAETTKVIGTARVLGNGGATLDSVVGAGTAPTNQQVVGALYNSTEISPSTGQAFALQADSKGRLRGVIMDAAGNTRGANVDANNNLGAVLAAETTKVIGTARVLGNGGATLDAVVTAGTAPTNMVAVGGVYNSTDLAPTNAQSTALQLDSHGKLKVRGEPRTFFATFGTCTRPANATPYTAADAVSNNGTAGSVTAQTATITDINDDPMLIEYMLINTTDTGVATKGFRAHLYRADPTTSTGIVGGDNAAFSTKRGSWIGSMVGVFKTFSDGSMCILAPEGASRIITTPVSSAATLYILYETIDAWTPSANSTTFIATIGGVQGRV